MTYSDFHNQAFEAKVTKALESVRRVLDVDRGAKIRLADDVDHEYQDKYKMADLMTNMTIVTLVSVLEKLGLTKDILRGLDKSKEITLCFCASESCKLAKEEVVDEPLPYTKETQESTTVTTELGTAESTTQKSTIEKIVKRVRKEYYTVGHDWEISVYSGTDFENRTILQERKGTTSEYIRKRRYDVAKDLPSELGPVFPPKKEYPDQNLSLTWLLQQIDTQELKSHFSIDTDNDDTKTPRRNEQMEDAFAFFRSANNWTHNLQGHFHHVLRRFSMEDASRNGYDEFVPELSKAIFVPIMPLMVDQTPNSVPAIGGDEEEKEVDEQTSNQPESQALVALPPSGTAIDGKSVTLSEFDTAAFLNEHAKTLADAFRIVDEKIDDFDLNCDLISKQETKAHVLSYHAQTLVLEFLQTIRNIEFMLKNQLVAAIGKEVGKADLDKFMRYHNENLFNPSPQRFCYTIRRPEHYPDGILGIEESNFVDGKEVIESISTHVRQVTSADPIKVPLNAATTISLTGKKQLHGWLNQRFGDQFTSPSVRLNARARQFSSFVLVVGTMTNQNQLQPKDAIILRNKDEVHIPLLLNEIPTATEFKNAIGSLSPEQQRFAKSFRSMQLDSSVLGVCVIQIKPQLERLLGLPEGALTKEMKLTEDLTELFIEYQIPSDLVSCDFDNEGGQSIKEQVENVRQHVKAVMDVITAQKEEQLEEQKKVTEMAKAKKKASGAPKSVRARSAVSASLPAHNLPLPCARSYRLSGSGVSAYSDSSPAYCPEYTLVAPVQYRGMAGVAMSQAEPALKSSKGSTARMLLQALPDECAEDDSFSMVQNESASADTNQNVDNDNKTKISPLEEEGLVFAAMPKILDQAIELHDKNAALRSTTIKTAPDNWDRIRQENLLSKPKQSALSKAVIASEKSRAFDLLDALSRSGSLDIPYSDLHVLICVTHGFEKSVMGTVIQDNINPIEKLELSTLLMASTILGVPSRDLIRNENDRKRLASSFPLLLTTNSKKSRHEETESANVDEIVTTDCWR